MRRVLNAGDLVLRPLVARDAGELFMLADAHRKALGQFMTWLDRTKAVADVSFYILNLDGFWKSGLTYGIFRQDTLMGTVGFHNADHRNDKAEIGYWLAPPYQGRGYATRAVGLAVDVAFRFTSIHRLEAKICPTNASSIKLIERLAFQREGLERQGLKFHTGYRDHYVYSLLRHERESS